MKMIRHHYKFVQEVFLLRSVVEEHLNKKATHSVGLEQILFLKTRSGDEVAAVPCGASTAGGHNLPQWLKPVLFLSHSIAALEALRHPRANKSQLSSNLNPSRFVWGASPLPPAAPWCRLPRLRANATVGCPARSTPSLCSVAQGRLFAVFEG